MNFSTIFAFILSCISLRSPASIPLTPNSTEPQPQTPLTLNSAQPQPQIPSTPNSKNSKNILKQTIDFEMQSIDRFCQKHKGADLTLTVIRINAQPYDTITIKNLNISEPKNPDEELLTIVINPVRDMTSSKIGKKPKYDRNLLFKLLQIKSLWLDDSVNMLVKHFTSIQTSLQDLYVKPLNQAWFKLPTNEISKESPQFKVFEHAYLRFVGRFLSIIFSKSCYRLFGSQYVVPKFLHQIQTQYTEYNIFEVVLTLNGSSQSSSIKINEVGEFELQITYQELSETSFQPAVTGNLEATIKSMFLHYARSLLIMGKVENNLNITLKFSLYRLFVILYFTHYTRVNTIYTILKGKKELTNVLIDPEYFDLLPVTLYKNWPFVGGGMRQILMNETDFGLMSYPPIVVETASLFETEEWNERVERIFSLIPITKTSENVTLSKQHVRWVIMFSCTKFWTIILGRPLTNDETAKLILLSSEEFDEVLESDYFRKSTLHETVLKFVLSKNEEYQSMLNESQWKVTFAFGGDVLESTIKTERVHVESDFKTKNLSSSLFKLPSLEDLKIVAQPLKKSFNLKELFSVILGDLISLAKQTGCSDAEIDQIFNQYADKMISVLKFGMFAVYLSQREIPVESFQFSNKAKNNAQTGIQMVKYFLQFSFEK